MKRYSITDYTPIVSLLTAGALAVFPTDTVYGIGCLLNNERSLDRLYDCKDRPANQPTALLCSSITMVEHYISSDITPYKNLLTRFWPGPLTIVVTANENAMIDKRLFGENQKIGVRIPLYQPLQTIIEHAELPLVASSANRKGETPLSSTEQISATFKDVIDVLVFDDAYCPLGTASTVIDVSTSTMKVLREGVISIKALESVL